MKFAFFIHIFLLFNLSSVFPQNDTILLINETKVEICYPEHAIKGTILVLPGWNFEQNDICKKSNFCDLASKYGYILVMPDMQKSIYHSGNYPETRSDWRKYHSYLWLTDTVFSVVQKRFNLLLPGDKNYLMGISTGGRGVAVLAIYTKGIFIAGAALSGDYDPTLNLSDNLMRGFLGDYNNYPNRWKYTENPKYNASQVTIPLYLGHGYEDKVVDPRQTTDFYDSLKVCNINLGHVLNIQAGAKHDYNFWSSEYPAVFEFFSKY